MSGLDCLSLLELPKLLVPLSVTRLTFLLLWEQLVLMVELGKAKGQKRFVDDLMVADKSSITCTTGVSIIIIDLIICYTKNKQKLTQHKLPPKKHCA